jgi:hypothetical protein
MVLYKKGEARWDEEYSPRTMHEGEKFYVAGRGARGRDPEHGVDHPRGRDFIIGGRAEVIALIADLSALLYKQAPGEPCPYGVAEDNTVRDPHGNVIAACAEQHTAAYLAILLDRSDTLAGDMERPAFTPWKGPYLS